MTQLYSLAKWDVNDLLTQIKNDEILIPAIQRPFVWNDDKVCDFIDSLYRGYPVGYLIVWLKSKVPVRDSPQSIRQGRQSAANEYITIDGQQRLMALLMTLHGGDVLNKKYERMSIRVAFNPVEERFEKSKESHNNNPRWISDISTVFPTREAVDNSINTYLDANQDYLNENQNVTPREIRARISRLSGICDKNLGVIKLKRKLEGETVADIFDRINSRGIRLTSPDFIMSKMAASEDYGGPHLRKSIDYFCQLATSPTTYENLAEDTDFAGTEYFHRMKWLKDWDDSNDKIYVPNYTDMLKVVFTVKFERGDLKDLIPRLSGNNAEDSFCKLKDGILEYINEHNFRNFVMILHSAGFTNPSMIKAKNAVNFAYVLYLRLREENMDEAEVKKLVGRWFVMSVLTGRYSGEPQATFGRDIRGITEGDLEESTEGDLEESVGEKADAYLNRLELTELSDAFWDVEVLDKLNTSSTKSVYFNMFLASQIKRNAKGFLSRDDTIHHLLRIEHDKHHIFPENYLKGLGIRRKKDRSNIANLVVMERNTNIILGGPNPVTYFSALQDGCRDGKPPYGGIENIADLYANLEDHCIPLEEKGTSIFEDYNKFLKTRRQLMAEKIKKYYYSL